MWREGERERERDGRGGQRTTASEREIRKRGRGGESSRESERNLDSCLSDALRLVCTYKLVGSAIEARSGMDHR